MENRPLTRARFWRVSVPYLEEWTSSPEFGPHPNSDRLILELQDSAGLTGWGEGPWKLSVEETSAALQRLLACSPAELRPSFLDSLWAPGAQYWQQPPAPSFWAPPLENLRHRLRHPLQVAVETALGDLQARRLGLPLSALYGGTWRDRVACDYWMGRTTPAHAARCAERALELGFRGLKLKTTLEDPNVERLESIKRVAGVDFHVTVDPNGRFYRLDDSLPTLRAMDGIGNLRIIEDAFPRTALAETRELRRRINARVVVHIDPPESLGEVLLAQCCGGLNLDSHAQGFFAWRFQAAAADQFNLPVWHGSGLDLGIYTAAQLHVASTAPNCQLPGDQAGPWLRESTLVREPFRVEKGFVLVPPGPGLGVTPDLFAIERYAVAGASLGESFVS